MILHSERGMNVPGDDVIGFRQAAVAMHGNKSGRLPFPANLDRERGKIANESSIMIAEDDRELRGLRQCSYGIFHRDPLLRRGPGRMHEISEEDDVRGPELVHRRHQLFADLVVANRTQLPSPAKRPAIPEVYVRQQQCPLLRQPQGATGVSHAPRCGLHQAIVFRMLASTH